MKSSTVPKFWSAYADLPTQVKAAAHKQFLLWLNHPGHPSLQFKKSVHFGQLALPKTSERFVTSRMAPTTGFGLEGILSMIEF